MRTIASRENRRFKELLRLAQSSRARRLAGTSLLDGVHLVAAYIAQGWCPEVVAVSRSGLLKPEIQGLLSRTNAELLQLDDGLFRDLSPVETPTGILAAVATPRPAVGPSETLPSLWIEDIQDPGNLGSILRSAAAAGLRQVILSRGSVHAWSPRVLRAGMGAHFVLQVHEQVDLFEFAHRYKGKIIATCQRAGASVFEADITGEVALILGNEGAGVSLALRKLAHAEVSIPMPGEVESLNVAAAAAICLFERVRQGLRQSHTKLRT